MTRGPSRPPSTSKQHAIRSSPVTVRNVTRLLCALLLAGFCIQGRLPWSAPLWAGSTANKETVNNAADAERGRNLFNDKGVCAICHGIDGHRDRLPEKLSPNVRKNIAHLDPPPSDLRNPAGLKLTNDKERFEVIRHGHARTAMLPLSKQLLTDEDILHILAYLATLRGKVVTSAMQSRSEAAMQGDARNGKRLYHETGGCSICHGIEGRLDQRPQLSAELTQKLARLQPPPANLRDPAGLKSTTDEDRFRSVKQGHVGTAMFPKKLMSDDDIRDLVAYLGVLRKGGGDNPHSIP